IALLTRLAAGVRTAAMNADGSRVLILPGDKERMERGRSFSGSDGKLVLNTIEDRTVYVRDAATGKDLVVFRGHEDAVTGAAFHPSERQVVTASRDGTVRIWDATDRDEYATLLRGHTGPLGAAEFHPDGKLALTAYGIKHEVSGAEGGDRVVRIWDATTGKTTAVLKGLSALGDSPVRERLLGAVRHARFSPDGRRVLVVSTDYQARVEPPDPQASAKWTYTPVRIMDAQSADELIALKGFRCAVRFAAFSPDGRFVLTVAGTDENFRRLTPVGEQRGWGSLGRVRDHALRIWSASTGDLVRTLADKDHLCHC